MSGSGAEPLGDGKGRAVIIKGAILLSPLTKARTVVASERGQGGISVADRRRAGWARVWPAPAVPRRGFLCSHKMAAPAPLMAAYY